MLEPVGEASRWPGTFFSAVARLLVRVGCNGSSRTLGVDDWDVDALAFEDEVDEGLVGEIAAVDFLVWVSLPVVAALATGQPLSGDSAAVGFGCPNSGPFSASDAGDGVGFALAFAFAGGLEV
jgi:hypothetical protein